MKDRPERAIREAFDKGYLEHERFQHKGATVDFMGVFHMPQTLRTYGEDIKSSIERSNGVILEAAPMLQGFFDEEKMRLHHYTYVRQIVELPEFAERIGGAKAEDIVPFDVFWRGLKESSLTKFFTQVEKWVWESKKPLYITEISFASNEALQSNIEQYKLEDTKDAASKIVGLGAAGAVSYLFASVIADTLNNNPLINRRKLITGGAATALAFTAENILASIGIDRRIELDYMPYAMTAHRGEEGPQILHFQDARDVTLGAGIDIAAPRVAPGELAVVYGVAHLDASLHYVSHKVERIMKTEAYKKLLPTQISPMSVFERVDGDAIAWKLKESITQ